MTIDQRHRAFAGLLTVSIAVFWLPLRAIGGLSLSDDRYSHLLLIPVISLVLVYFERAKIFSPPRDRSGAASWLLVVAAAIYAVSFTRLASREHLMLAMVSAVLAWVGMFAFCYGSKALRAAVFPLGFLVFMIPIPEGVLNWMVHGLQAGSADVSAVLFRAIGMPSFRRGFRFLLPGVEIEVADECSGIHSTTALFLVMVLAAYVLLRSASRRTCFVLAAIPIGIFKNAVRIVTLSYLGVYVNRDYLDGKLHHQYGGLIFSSFSLLLVIPLLLLLRKSEATGEIQAS
jgi:exosortase